MAALAAAPKLAPLLAQHPAMLDATIAVLAAPHASSASRDASLAILEAILDLEQPTQIAVCCNNLGRPAFAMVLSFWIYNVVKMACSAGLACTPVKQRQTMQRTPDVTSKEVSSAGVDSQAPH